MSKSTLSVWLVGLVLGASSITVMGCDSSQDSTDNSQTEAAPAPKEVPEGRGAASATASPSASASASTTVSATLPSGLPPLDRGVLPLSRILASKDADKAGDDLDKQKDYGAAEKEYRRALELDAGNVFARYNVARTLVLQGNVPDGVAALATLKVDGCHLCTDRILAALGKDDFANAKNDPAFVAVTKDMHKSLFKVDVAATSVVDWFMTTPLPELGENEYVDPRSLVVIEDKTTGAKKRFVQLHGSEEFRKHVKEHYPKGIYPDGPRTCANGCCNFTGSPILGVHLKQMCFATSGTSAVHLKKITIEGNPEDSFPG